MSADRAVISVNKAARKLPIRVAEARAWLLDNGLVSMLAGRQVVIWADVEAKLRQTALQAPETPKRPRAPLPMGLHRGL